MRPSRIISLALISAALPSVGLAQTPASSALPADLVNQFLNFAFLGAGLLAFGMVVYGGIKYTLSAGNIASQADARDQITQALIGLLLLVGSGLILRTINPALINIELKHPTPVAGTTPGSTCKEPCSTGKCGKAGECIVCSLTCDPNTGTSCAFNESDSPYCASCPASMVTECQSKGEVCKFTNNIPRCEAKLCGDNNRFGPCSDPKQECVPFPGSSPSDRLWGCVDKAVSSPS